MANINLICIGVILDAHGILGEVKIKTFTQTPQQFLTYKPIYNDHDQPLIISKGRFVKDDIIVVKFTHINSRNDSETLKGQQLFIQSHQLTKLPLASGEILYQDLINLIVQDEQHQDIGKVIGVHNYGAGDLLEIKLFDKGEEIFIPFAHPDVGQIDAAVNTISVQSHLIEAFKATPRKLHD